MHIYLIIKSAHIISVISWMAGMFYLPRLFVYHADVPVSSECDKMLQIMERRLLRVIINPAMIATFLTGAVLVMQLGKEGLGNWFHLKILLVLGLTILHGKFAKWRKLFAQGKNINSSRFYRYMNEIPTVMMIGIVILVICKPF